MCDYTCVCVYTHIVSFMDKIMYLQIMAAQCPHNDQDAKTTKKHYTCPKKSARTISDAQNINVSNIEALRFLILANEIIEIIGSIWD